MEARDENTVADDLTNGVFTQVDGDKRITVRWCDLNFKLLETLWGTRSEFLDRDSWKFYHGSDGGHNFEKSAWG